MATQPISPQSNLPVRATAILNVRSGKRRQHEIAGILTRVFERHGAELRIGFARRVQDICSFAEQAATEPGRLLLAGGGDGTVSGVASVIAGTQAVMGVLPLGTFNLFARELGIPEDLEAAAELCFQGEARTLPVAEVNERVFLNNASLGLYPAMLRVREEAYHRWGRMRLLAYLAGLATIVRPGRHMELEIETAERRVHARTPLVFVARNAEQVAQFGMEGADCVRAGNLGFYILPPLGRMGLLRMGMKMLLRRVDVHRDLQFLCAKTLRVNTRRSRVRLAYDGEIETVRSPLLFTVRPNALRVLVPRAQEAA